MMESRRPVSPKVPRGEARRRELLLEAARILLRDGLDGASMDSIAAEAGASKATLYRHFGDRTGLVVAVVHHLCNAFVSDVVQDPPPDADLHDALKIILSQLIQVLAKPQHPDFFRLIVSGTKLDPAIGRAWHQHGPMMWQRMLRDVFERQRALGRISANADYSQYPELLFNAVFTEAIVRTVILDKDGIVSDESTGHLDTLLHLIIGNISSNCQ
ncbi:hypothetical protein CLG96_06260 [Sphingomonas oleivorans]|uniref:HTH tetR-type domain-containing protein n=1 Tax=Sphingomonas oleivorans TaxID=1735121 RepID=A0A2T5FZS8_9SPHN|nr:TetR/AcrR family transcriptional regulator [Sphingomonas oleivorans]PTQ12157.1 hypothetical protein CLG96_06260 [Sphingomonas oleivorans]